MPNEPIVGERFFGRSEVLDLVRKRVDALKEGYRQNIALTGQNLSGKSSILHNFLYTFNDNQILPIYVEITDEPFGYFSQRFIGSLLYSFLKLKDHEPEEDLESLIEASRPYIPHTVKYIIEIQDLLKRKNFDEAYSQLFNLTSVIKEETGKSCVIIFDEFHNLASLNVKYPFKNFGKKIMVQKDTMYIVTSSQVSTVKRILNEKLSLLFGNFEVIQVSGFSAKNAVAFLNQRLKYIRFPEEYKDFIISLTEGNPFYLDVISQAIKDIVLSMTFKRVSQDTLIEALERTIFNSKGTISQYLNNSLEAVRIRRPSQAYLSVLLAVANGSCRLQEISKMLKKRTGDISKYANDLVEMNLLYKNGSFYKFVDKMLAFYLKFVYQRKRSAIISYLPDRINIFKSEMKMLIELFLSEEKKELLERILNLFSRFNNEVVSISDKEYKLPPFSSLEIRRFENAASYMLARTKKNHWVVAVIPEELKDIDIIEFVERTKSIKAKIQRRLLIALSDIEMNARLLAKEEKLWIWDLNTLNHLMSLYGKERIVSFIHQTKRGKVE